MRSSVSVDLPEPFRCEVQPNGKAVYVVPHGELDLSTAPELDRRIQELVEQGSSRIVVDLAGLTFLDSTGANLLLRWTQSARAGDWSLELLPGCHAVQRLFEMAGLVDALPFALRSHP